VQTRIRNGEMVEFVLMKRPAPVPTLRDAAEREQMYKVIIIYDLHVDSGTGW